MMVPGEMFAISLIAKATAVFCIGGAVAFITRRKSASVQRAVWALTIAAAAGLPLGMVFAPEWRVAILPSATTSRALRQPSPTGETLSQPSNPGGVTSNRLPGAVGRSDIADAEPMPVSRPPGRPTDIGVIIVGIWMAGATAVLGRMIIGMLALARVKRRAVELDDSEWTRIVLRERNLAEVSKDVRVLASADVSTPLTFGVVAPTILLPEEFDGWTAEHRSVVVRHEMAHISSGDMLTSLLAGFTCAVYWFHPLAWYASARLRRAQERACDNQVLQLGVAPADYAAHLLEVARSAKEIGMPGFVSVAMARPSQLEGRLLAVLNEGGNRGVLSVRSRTAGAITTAAVLISVSAFSPMPRAVGAIAPARANLVERSMLQTPRVAAPALKSVPAIAAVTGRKSIADSTIEQDLAVAPGGTLLLDLETGASLTIRGSRTSRIHMRVTLGGRDWRSTGVSLVKQDGGARLSLHWIGSARGGSSSHRIELTVPEEYSIRLKSAGGGFDLADVSGDFSGSTGGGEIKIARANGNASLSTGGGSVVVTNSNLAGSVSTGGGSVLIQRVNGGLRGSSGTGNVLYGREGLTFSGTADGEGARGSDGKLYVRKSGGSVAYGSLEGGADINTGGGRISIASARGDVSASTGGGDIRVGTVTGSAELSTGAGDVSVSVTGPSAHRVKVSSGNGKVTVTLPSDMSATLDLETGYTEEHGRTRIDSDWNIPITETGNWDATHGSPRRFVRSRASIGGGNGGTVRVRTTNGDIVLRRSR